jgi:methionyl aminopeptidase
MSNSNQYLDIFRENGRHIAKIRQELVEYAYTEFSMAKIDELAVKLIKNAGGEPAFQKVPGYRWATCICVNDCLVHGIPDGYLKPGDLVTIDVGMSFQDTTTDVATTFCLEPTDPQKLAFLEVGKKTLRKAIAQAKAGNRIRHISEVLQRIPEQAGYSVTRNLVGHGLGKTMHEPPSVPCFVSRDPNLDAELIPGMVITIEVMYMEGNWPLKQAPDGWGLYTADGSLAAMFEEDILITSNGPEVISAPSGLEAGKKV